LRSGLDGTNESDDAKKKKVKKKTWFRRLRE